MVESGVIVTDGKSLLFRPALLFEAGVIVSNKLRVWPTVLVNGIWTVITWSVSFWKSSSSHFSGWIEGVQFLSASVSSKSSDSVSWLESLELLDDEEEEELDLFWPEPELDPKQHISSANQKTN